MRLTFLEYLMNIQYSGALLVTPSFHCLPDLPVIMNFSLTFRPVLPNISTHIMTGLFLNPTIIFHFSLFPHIGKKNENAVKNLRAHQRTKAQ